MGKYTFYHRYSIMLLITLPSVVTQFSEEKPPRDFRVEFLWRDRGTAFNRLDFFKTVLNDMALLAIKDFQMSNFAVKCPAPFQIAFNFVSDRTAPGMKVKHIMWTLNRVFELFVAQERYEPGNIIIEIPPTRIGVGNVQFNPLIRSSNASTERISGVSHSMLIPTASDLTIHTDALDIRSNSSDARATFAAKKPRVPKPAEVTEGKNVYVRLTFYHDSHTFPDDQIFNASFQLLLRAGQPANKHDGIGPLFSTYNDIANFTMSLAPHAYVKTNELSWIDCINAIKSIGIAMSEHGPEGIWEELSGSIRDDQQVIGKFCIEKGDRTNADPETVCIREEQGSINEQ